VRDLNPITKVLILMRKKGVFRHEAKFVSERILEETHSRG
jgi:hypothetical protein